MAKFYTHIQKIWDGDRYVTVSFRTLDYDGPFAECKGDDVAKQSEADQATFDKQLMTMMQSQYSKQSSALAYLTSKMQPMIDNPTGYSPAALTAMRTSATDTISSDSQNAQQALNEERSQVNGGSDLPSGVDAQLDAALLNSESVQKSQAQNNITLANENLKQSNYWNAVSALNGVATEYNPTAYSGQATSGGATVADLSQANTAASGPTFGAILGGVVSGVAGGVGAYYGHKG